MKAAKGQGKSAREGLALRWAETGTHGCGGEGLGRRQGLTRAGWEAPGCVWGTGAPSLLWTRLHLILPLTLPPRNHHFNGYLSGMILFD